MRIAITGASGHVGANLARLLLADGHELRLLVHRNQAGVESLAADLVRGDVTDAEAMRRLVAGAEAVVHSAARISIDGDPDGEVARINVAGTRTVVEACLAAGAGRLVHVSSIHSYDPLPLDQPLDESRGPAAADAPAYDRSKLAADRIVLDAVARGLDAVIVAPTAVIGPHDYYPSLAGKAVVDLIRGRVPLLAPGGYDFVDARDVGRGIAAAIGRGRTGEKYILSGHFLTIRELARLVGEAAGCRVPRTALPVWLLRALLPVLRGVARVQGTAPALTAEGLRALTHSNPRVRSAKARAELGYTARPAAETVADTVAWFRQAGRLA